MLLDTGLIFLSTLLYLSAAFDSTCDLLTSFRTDLIHDFLRPFCIWFTEFPTESVHWDKLSIIFPVPQVLSKKANKKMVKKNALQLGYEAFFKWNQFLKPEKIMVYLFW